MIGALFLSLIVAHRRRLIDLAIGIAFATTTLLIFSFFPLAAACALWALLLIPAIVHATSHDVGEDEHQ